MSKEYGQLPSEVYRVEDELAAFYFDRAVSSFGQLVEADINKATQGKEGAGAEMAAQLALQKWIKQETGPKYADPAKARRRGR